MSLVATHEEKASAQERILLAAEQQFARNGYAGTRVSDIAEAAEVNVALISYYFESKEKLYHGVLQRLFGLWEKHAQENVWNDDDPERMLPAYIRKHLEFKRNNLNMVRIFQWENLINMGIYEHYINKYWEKDVKDKLEVLHRWKRQGKLNANLNENAVLALIWGMMDRLLLLNSQSLGLFLGEDVDADREEAVFQACADAIIQMAIYGAMPRPQEASAGLAEPVIRLVTLGEQAENSPELQQLLQKLETDMGTPIREHGVAAPDQWSNRPNEALLLVADTRDGDLTDQARTQWLAFKAAASGGELTDRPVAVWVAGGDREAQPLQTLLEQQLGGWGAFPLQRRADQTPAQFALRFAQYVKRMQMRP